ncbi:DNA circularization protein [Salmonella enterica]|nr:DNA circularization protein [Salmonella enterica]
MTIIQEAINELAGNTGNRWYWSDHIQPASFRGIPFAVEMSGSTFGRRQASHEYPYRDKPWIEDMGRSVRRFTLRGFLVQDSRLYRASDVITQRNNLIAACERGEPGTLVHPTLGEMTVCVPEGGLRIEESAKSGRMFSFTLSVMETGIKVFAVTDASASGGEVEQGWLSATTVAAAHFIAAVGGEARSVMQAVRTLQNTARFWQNSVVNAVDQVTSLSNSLNSTFGSLRYGRYCRGLTGGTVSGATGRITGTSAGGSDDDVIRRQMAKGVTGRAAIQKAADGLLQIHDVEDFSGGVMDTIRAVVAASGSPEEKLSVLESLAAYRDTRFYPVSADADVAARAVALIVVMSAAAMAYVAMSIIPSSQEDAWRIQQRVCDALDSAMIQSGDLSDDNVYNVMRSLYNVFTDGFSLKGTALSNLAIYSFPRPLPALTLAERIWQDAGRADELIQSVQPVHPAFMPVRFKALSS